MKDSELTFEYNYLRSLPEYLELENQIEYLFTLADAVKSDYNELNSVDEDSTISYSATIRYLSETQGKIEAHTARQEQIKQQINELKDKLSAVSDHIKSLKELQKQLSEPLPSKLRTKAKNFSKIHASFCEQLAAVSLKLPMEKLPSLKAVKSFYF